MSSLWTPGGEVPVGKDPEPTSAGAPGAPGGSAPAGEPTPEEMQAQFEEATRQLVAMPAADVITQHAIGCYELAAIHLSQPEPNADAARLAIDALAAILDGVGDRLGEAGAELSRGLPQLRLACVEVTKKPSDDDTGG